MYLRTCVPAFAVCTEQCAIRELEEETGLKVTKVHQIGAYSKVDRDPRGRTITVAYLAIIDSPEDVKGQDNATKLTLFHDTTKFSLNISRNLK